MSKLSDTIGQFATIPNAFIEQSATMSHPAFRLFVILRYYTNSRSGEAFPDYETIHKMTGMHRRLIARAIRELEAVGWIERRRRFGSSTIYTLKIPTTPISATIGTNESAAISATGGTVISTNGGTISSTTRMHTNQTDLNQTDSNQTLAAKPARDPLTDMFNAHLKAQSVPRETVIRAWNLPVHLQDICILFAHLTGVDVTRGDKGKWSRGAMRLNELTASSEDYKAALERMAKDKLTCTHPLALYETLKAAMQTNHKQAEDNSFDLVPVMVNGYEEIRRVPRGAGK